MGTSTFAVPSFEKLIASKCNIVGVVTQPDRPRGRGKKVLPTPVKEVALKHNLSIYQPHSIKDSDTINYILAWEPDLIVVVSYGQIIPREIIDYPRYGCVNLHASLLPEYRGAAPIQRAIMEGKKVSGITTMFMDEGLDTGDIIMQVPIPINDNIDHGDYELQLANEGVEILLDTIRALECGSMPRRKQDNSKTSYAPMITKEEEKINWHNSAVDIHNKIRGLSPNPGAFTIINDTKVKIFATTVIDTEARGQAGEVVDINNVGFAVQTAKGILLIKEVQRAGKNKMNAKDFLRGFNLNKGDLL